MRRSWERELLDWHSGPATDQAAGLRRLFRTRPARAVAFVSGRESCGRTTLLVHTAAALAEAGESVVIVDENPGPDNVHRVFGLKARHDLLDLVQRDLPMQRIVQPVAARLSLLSAAEFVAAVTNVDASTALRLNTAFRQLQEGSSYVLIDCAAGKGRHLSPLALAAPQMAVVVAAQGTAITTAYALVKRLVQERGREGFQVAITRAGSDREALSIFHNMRQTAQDHLGVRLDYLGSARVPSVDHLADALQGSLSQSSGAGDWFGFLPASRGNALSVAPRGRLAPAS
jgi:flagellar biosynthesis protein FlhG